MEALAKLGIDWKLLLAQVVNFAVLFFVLRRYAYRPMLAFLDERKERIDRGLRNAEEATKRLEAAGVERESVLQAARAEARLIVEAAETAARERDAKRLAETEERVTSLLADGKRRGAEEQARLLAEAKEELAETVVLAVEKVLREKLTEETDRKLIHTLVEETK
jgi:F-type H+-transporting ATPase subunit b